LSFATAREKGANDLNWKIGILTVSTCIYTLKNFLPEMPMMISASFPSRWMPLI
jgi:hypothetical protein